LSCTDDYSFRVGQEVLRVDPGYFRPTEVDLLIGDASKVRALGWKPKYSLQELVTEMVDADLHSFKQEKMLIDSGYHITRQYE
jgi:GDPmannose 4,6-dehydratase